ncbi:MAG: ABC transporter ATP-binding protein [Candidatus Omnitrophica bacterium]|nr:ABC transporter ATP-binding protein [Candidatus Omnitrophota bacterium]
MKTLLEIKNLHTYFYTDSGTSRAVEGVSFNIPKGETVALVGESGCGKTVTALSIMRLVPAPGEIIQGEVIFQEEDLLDLPSERMRSIRGRDIGMIFQEPMSSLDPLYTIGYQIAEVLLAHKKIKKGQAKEQVLELLKRAEIPSADKRYSDFPHNLSGGLRQRAMIAQALACNPALLIADEPTTALDVTIQAQILQLFSRLKETTDMSILLITHNLGIVAEVADRVCIMYAGRIVEEADVLTIFSRAKHPYTQGLLRSIPARQGYSQAQREAGGPAPSRIRERLFAIPGAVPHPESKPSGCPFHPRCAQADAKCKSRLPLPREIESGHKVSCWKAR